MDEERLTNSFGCKEKVCIQTDKIYDSCRSKECIESMRVYLTETGQEIIDRANVKKTYFTLEPMPWMIPTSPQEYIRLLEDVDRDRFAVHMDIINMINSAERYFNAKEFIDECAEVLGNRIRSCHIKDVHLNEKYTFQLVECGPGDGEFPLHYYVQKMNEIDSQMPVILEHLDSDEQYIKYMNYLKKTL